MEKKVLYEGEFLRMYREGCWEYADRVNANGAVMVIAMTNEREMILIEEYRYPVHAETIGLPAGVAGDKENESMLDSARREFWEETGYEAEKWELLTEGPSSPGLSTEMVYFFRAENLKKISSGGGVGGECIKVHLVPLDKIEGWLKRQTGKGKLIDPRIYMGIYFLSKK